MFKKIISECMFFVCGMIAGKSIFNNVEIWKTAFICLGAFVILWLVWDGITDQKMEG